MIETAQKDPVVRALPGEGLAHCAREPVGAGRRKPLRVTVLAGGPGPEREVSLDSGQAVYRALLRLGHKVLLRDVSPNDLAALEFPADVVFIALHGPFGEDGEIQTVLEKRGLAYCGSGPEASRIAMNKAAAKERFREAGIPTPRYEVALPHLVDAVAERFALPAVVKPVSSGSSVDTFLCRERDALRKAIGTLVERYAAALVETYIDGPELTVGILGDKALPVCQIRPAGEFYDYEAKYLDDRTEYLFDIDLPGGLLRRVQEWSVAAHRRLECRVFSRVDWMIDGRTHEPFVLEVNTIPGFTSHSLLPKAAARAGIHFDELCERIIDLSLSQSR